jgi:hypothetical protein
MKAVRSTFREGDRKIYIHTSIHTYINQIRKDKYINSPSKMQRKLISEIEKRKSANLITYHESS